MYPRTRQNRVPSIHERDILGFVLAERIYRLCKTVDAGTMTIKDRREREKKVDASFLSSYGKRDGWWFPVWHRALDPTYSASGSLGGASENLRDPCNSAMESVSITQYPRIRPKVWASSSLFERRFSYGHVFVARGQPEITRLTFRWKREERRAGEIVRYFFFKYEWNVPSPWNGFRE